MAWLADWIYRKSVTLSRTSGAVTNYQMKLLVGESSGATGENVDCGGYCLPTFNDLRFTKADGTTPLDYWIESIAGTTPNQLATVWIEFDSIGTAATTFFMYYGKADAASVSNGVNTFPFFDDFIGDSINGDKWTVTGDVSVANSEVSLTDSDRILGKTAYGYGYAVRAKSKATEQDSAFVEWQYDMNNRISIDNSDYISNDVFTTYALSAVLSGSNADPGPMLTSAEDFRNTYAIYEILRNAQNSTVFTKYGASGTYAYTLTTTTYVYTGNMYPSVRVWDSSQESTLVVDWVLVVQQLATGPAWGSWGAEENNLAAVACYLHARRDRMNMRPVSTQNQLE